MSTFPVSQPFPQFAARPAWRPPEGWERIAGAVLFVLSLPVLVAAAAAIRVLSGRSPLVAHRRVGFGGGAIWVYKLRTMWKTPAREPFRFTEYLAKQNGEARKSRRDPRITSRFAALCRRYSIDELPQLWQVARGELALVGPRPITAHELERYYGASQEVLSARPGLTGLWQIRGRGHLTYSQRRRLDLFLVRKFSWPLYVRILLRTPFRVLSGTGAW